MKRIFDVALALLLGILLGPVFLLIAIALKATSPGPLLFRQERLGKGGSIFLMNKFRKFPANWGTAGPSVTLQFDSRMTRIGQLLERTKLDELPQLWNIFIGNMSFVGPRPETTNFIHLFKGEYRKLFDYTPGIFGPNQAKYRNESAMYPDDVDPEVFYQTVLFPDKAKRDINYFSKSTFATDVRWIVSGAFALVFSVVIWRRSSRATAILCSYDVITVLLGWGIAYFLKFGLTPEKLTDKKLFLLGLVILPFTTLVIFAVARVYRNPARYFSETDFYRLSGAVCAVWISAAVSFGFLLKSTSSLLLATSCILSIILMAVPRMAYQLFWKTKSIRQAGKHVARQVNIAVCGISNQSVELCNFLSVGFPRANVIGLVDLDNQLVRREIHGFEVLGTYSDLDVLHAKHSIDFVWLSTDVSAMSHSIIANWCSVNNVAIVVLSNEKVFQPLLAPSASLGTTSAKRIPNKLGKSKKQKAKDPIEIAV